MSCGLPTPPAWCPSQPQLVEGRGVGVVSGDGLINFDSITTAMAASAQSQVTIAHKHIL